MVLFGPYFRSCKISFFFWAGSPSTWRICNWWAYWPSFRKLLLWAGGLLHVACSVFVHSEGSPCEAKNVSGEIGFNCLTC